MRNFAALALLFTAVSGIPAGGQDIPRDRCFCVQYTPKGPSPYFIGRDASLPACATMTYTPGKKAVAEELFTCEDLKLCLKKTGAEMDDCFAGKKKTAKGQVQIQEKYKDFQPPRNPGGLSYLPSGKTAEFIVEKYYKAIMPDWMTWEISGAGSQLNCEWSSCVSANGLEQYGNRTGPGKKLSRVLGGRWQMRSSDQSRPFFSSEIRLHPALAVEAGPQKITIRTKTKDPSFRITSLRIRAEKPIELNNENFWDANLLLKRLPGEACAKLMNYRAPGKATRSYHWELPIRYTDYDHANVQEGPTMPYQGMKYPSSYYDMSYNMTYSYGDGIRPREAWLPYKARIVCAETPGAAYIFQFWTRDELFYRLLGHMNTALESFELLKRGK